MAQQKISFADFQSSHQSRLKDLKNLKYGDKKKEGGGGNYKPSILSLRMKYWRPTETPTRVMLIPWTQEQKFYSYFQSWIKNGSSSRTVISNSRGGELPVPDLVTYYAHKEENPKILPMEKFACSVLVLEDFHKVEKTSRKGTKYTQMVRCGGTDRYNRSACEHCDEGIEKVFGNLYHWSMGWGHKKQLEEAFSKLLERCGSCGEGTISVWGFGCPECGGVIADQKKERLSDDDIEFFMNGTMDCPHCEKAIQCEQLTECVHELPGKWVKGCDNPSRLNPWGAELLISTTGSGSSTAINIDLKDWEPTLTKEVADWKTKGFEFDKFFAFDTLAEQAKLMGRDNPFDDEAEKLLADYFSGDQQEEKAVDTEAIPY